MQILASCFALLLYCPSNVLLCHSSLFYALEMTVPVSQWQCISDSIVCWLMLHHDVAEVVYNPVVQGCYILLEHVSTACKAVHGF